MSINFVGRNLVKMAANSRGVSAAVSFTRSFTSRPHPTIDRMIRVDHAGEFGADRIYAGQVAILGDTSVGPVVKVPRG